MQRNELDFRISRPLLAGALVSGLLAPTALPAAPAASSKPITPTPTKAATVKPAAATKAAPAAKGKEWDQAAPAAAVIPPLNVPAGTSPTTVIDQVVAKHWLAAKVTPAPLCDDRTYVRRIYLDLAGRIPTPEEVTAFLGDHTPGKRASLVDKLLASPEYSEHMRDVFDVVFMGRGRGTGGQRRRRGGANQAQGLRPQWMAYLERSFSEDRPWNQIVHDIVLARPKSPQDAGAVWYLYARNDKYQEMAESVSASVFGVQVQCAQCHNHFLSPEIKQKDYWGLVAFFTRSKNANTKEGPRVSESAVGGFSNFATLAGQSFPAELTFFDKMVPEVRPAANTTEQDKPELYQPLPAGIPTDEPKVPVFSRREKFVDQVLDGNPLVARAAVNRFWELLVGRGFVHPVDKMDSQHKPSHPELLDWLAKDFEKNNYDVKRLVRSIVLSKPYQLTVQPTGTVRPELFAVGMEKSLTAEQLYRSLMVATTGKTDAEDAELEKRLVEIFPDVFPEEMVSNLRQAMFLTNNTMVQKLTEVRPDTTAARLAAIADPAARVRLAFQVAYGRDPDPVELKTTVAYLKSRAAEGPQATAQLWWALLSGAEFRFNH